MKSLARDQEPIQQVNAFLTNYPLHLIIPAGLNMAE
ncbi:hypothetical protein SBV1_3520002 [Verrucomicrobia bacterium]|nr:hypothetical protein SBV1_3520002 [Verrucomicrobiota bacterium]